MKAACMVALLLAGCVSPAPDVGPEPAERPVDAFTVEAPEYAVGDYWTIDPEGPYFTTNQMTIVVAETGNRVLFAGATPDDLVGHISWGWRWFGWFEEGFDRVGGDPEFDFPLFHGKTWSSGDATATAIEADVDGPTGPERGFRIEASRDGEPIGYWTYVPSISYYGEWGGANGPWARTVDAGSGSDWTWYDEIARLESPQFTRVEGHQIPAASTRYEITDEQAIVIHAATWSEGSYDLYDPAGQAQWHDSNAGTERWVQAIVDAEPGWWTLTKNGGLADGNGYISATAVDWIQGTA